MNTCTRALCTAIASLLYAHIAGSAEPRLSDRDYLDIEQLNARYVYAVDNCTNNGNDYAELYTEDGSFGVSQAWGATDGRVFAKGREALARAGGGSKDGCVERPKSSPVYGIRHIATSLVITPTATGAVGRSTLLAIGVGGNPTQIEWQGGYEDVYVKTPVGWRIKSRWHVWIGMESSIQYKDMQRATAAAAAAPVTPAAPANPPAPPVPTMRGDGPAPPPRDFSVTRLLPGMDAVVARNAKLELLASGFGLNEGPVWVRDGNSGYLLVSGLLDNVIYKIAADKTVSVFLEKAGYSGSDIDNVGAQTRSGRSHVLLIGPSCTGLDSQGRLIWCADNDRTVMRLEKDGTRTVLASGAGGKRFSGPNDIAVSSKDAIYLTDNDFGLRGAGRSADKQMENAVWLITSGEPRMVLTRAALGGIPNGVALSPDERHLYLSAQSKLMRYDVTADGSLGAGTLFAEGPGIGDGIKVDAAGYVFSTGGAGPGTVRVMAPDGALLGMINLPIYAGEPKRQICATNVVLGGIDRKSLYITACDAVYRLPLR